MPKHSGVSRFLQNYAGKNTFALCHTSLISFSMQKCHNYDSMRNSSSISDVTIDEFANSNVVKEGKRIRKKNVNSIKEIPLHVDTDVVALDDDDLDTMIANKMTNLKLKETTDAAECVQHDYNTYPIDLWYLISSHIQPEDVLRFALICKQTYAITTTMKFWRAMYKRHYTGQVELPVRLQPDCMARPGGIRACSIRSMYFTYAPFVQRLLMQPKQDFHLLTKRYVERFWFSQINSTKWQYFYKLKRKPMQGSRIAESEALRQRNGRSLKSLRDIYLNSEEGCALLVVSSTSVSQAWPAVIKSVIAFRLLRSNHPNSIHCLAYRTKWKPPTTLH